MPQASQLRRIHRYLFHIADFARSDVFTSIGVLLYLRTMDSGKLELLNHPPDNGALGLGLRFLSMASRSSKLAARYKAMLDQILRATSNHAQDVTQPSQSIPGPELPIISQDPTRTSRNLSEMEDFSLMDYLDPQDLLFGTGLPQDFLSTDWPVFGDLT